jgi:hypothetical protein
MIIRALIVLIVLSTSVYADSYLYTIPWQDKLNSELYSQRYYAPYEPYIDLQLQHEYDRFDDIFILPAYYYGESEYYDLNFWVDSQRHLNTAWQKHSYRIYYYFPEMEVDYRDTQIEDIPEPSVAMLLVPGICFMLTKRS